MAALTIGSEFETPARAAHLSPRKFNRHTFWCGQGGSGKTDALGVVPDLGGFDHPAEPQVAALAVLERLWARRAERKPILIVIDEAHNLCPPNPRTEVERAHAAARSDRRRDPLPNRESLRAAGPVRDR
ncbi:hypothetical protein [Microbacterium sp. ZXX196]|uniref:hypothetical protein n=1 Tax=Microbacterium sp. ZXX196 TaxID=2609291 RepID=UPI001E58E6D1|nr:hypothetical protein [Microbacterium sp. ZXX196]